MSNIRTVPKKKICFRTWVKPRCFIYYFLSLNRSERKAVMDSVNIWFGKETCQVAKLALSFHLKAGYDLSDFTQSSFCI